MKTVARFIALPVLMVGAWVASSYASLYWVGLLFPVVLPRPYIEMVTAEIVGAITAALVTAIPLARLYGRSAWMAGLVVSAPWIALRTSDLLQYWDKNEPRIVVMSWFELLLYPFVIAGAAHLLYRHRVQRLVSSAAPD